MSKSLVIVESPAKAKTINKFLGKDYLVIACNGHIRDLPPKRLGVKVDDDFTAEYEIIKGKKRIINDIKKKAGESDEILLAADHDREGEAICWHLKQIIGDKKPVHRVLFNEITRKSINEAIKHPQEIDNPKVNAQQARRILDRLVGYQISPILWKKVRAGLSAGRVQSVALRMICDRENEIQAFVIEEYWNVAAELLNDKKQLLTAKLHKINGAKPEITNEEQANKIVSESQKKPFIVEAVDKKKKRRKSPLPFITSKLQQEAAHKLKFSPRKTMMLAQQLYEGMEIGGTTAGLITYMRTDSVRVADEAIMAARDFIKEKYGAEFLPAKPKFYKNKKGAQDAHEAIRPTSLEHAPDTIKSYLSNDQYRLYLLIWNRFIASQTKDAVVEVTSVDVANGPFLYRISGQVILFRGFLAVYQGSEEEKDGILPPVALNEELKLKEILPTQHFTKPPPRYTEATLVKALEENGIGRPSTYAAIIDTIESRNYVTKEKRVFTPTEIGMMVTPLLIENFPQILDIKFTASMEEQLDEVEAGSVNYIELLKKFYTPFSKALKDAGENMTNVKKTLEEKTGIICEQCGAEMIIRWGRRGKFIACPGFPKCKNTKPLEAEEGEDKMETVKMACNKCGGEMVVKHGRFGKFLACANFPKCKNTKPMPTGAMCPKPDCDGYVGMMRSKKSKLYYGCSNYPDCDFRSWDLPINEKCPTCGSAYLVEKNIKGEGKHHVCPVKECDYKTPVSD